MKKKHARLTALFLCLMMSLTMTGCDVDFGAILLVKKAYDAIMNVESFRVFATAQAEGLSGGKKVSISAEADGACVVNPLAATLNAEFDLGPQGKYKVPFYMMEENEGVTLYVGARASGCDIWFRKPLDATIDAFSNAAQVVLKYMKDCTEPISRGEAQEINGRQAEPLSVLIPGDALMQTDEKGKVIPGEHPIKNLRVTIWIDEETSLPLRVESDIQALVQYYLERLDVAVLPELTVESLPVTIDIYGYDEVNSVTLPEEAKVIIPIEEDSIEAALNPTGKNAAAQPSPKPSPADKAAVKPSPEPSPTDKGAYS